MLRNRWFSQIVLAAGVMFISVTASFAGMIENSQGFEAPAYSSGALQGSNSWVQIGSGGTATVESTEKFSGSQDVQVNRAANSGARWLVPVSGYPELPNKIIQISWDMKVLQNPSSAAGAYGPFFGVEAYDGPKGSPALLFGSLGVDAKTLDVLYQMEGTGDLTETGTKVGLDWNHFLISLDFTSHQYSAYLNYNSTPLVTTGFVDGSSLNSFTDADISALAAGYDPTSQAFTGTAYYDNFQVQQVPEPSSLAMCMVGFVMVAGLAWRRRSR
ncbi:MAG: PEP-CTERM sorting domain-containing protein [Planctomycetota bacterium]